MRIDCFSGRNRLCGPSALRLLLQCLSAYDSLVCGLSFLCFSAPVLAIAFGASHYAGAVHPRIVPFAYAALHAAITGSDYLNLAAAVER